METKFKDVAHLYLGCKVRDQDGDNYYDFLQYSIHGEFVIHSSENGIVRYTHDGLYQPILRRLSSLREEDIQQWAADRMPEGFTIKPTQYCIEVIDRDPTGSFIGIYPDGSILERSMDDGDSRPFNGGLLFHLLLSKYFDLFGLIDSGQAIDEATLKS